MSLPPVDLRTILNPRKPPSKPVDNRPGFIRSRIPAVSGSGAYRYRRRRPVRRQAARRVSRRAPVVLQPVVQPVVQQPVSDQTVVQSRYDDVVPSSGPKPRRTLFGNILRGAGSVLGGPLGEQIGGRISSLFGYGAYRDGSVHHDFSMAPNSCLCVSDGKNAYEICMAKNGQLVYKRA